VAFLRVLRTTGLFLYTAFLLSRLSSLFSHFLIKTERLRKTRKTPTAIAIDGKRLGPFT
jgi:uncharacterized membrane protein YbaN (DUF454 family)